VDCFFENCKAVARGFPFSEQLSDCNAREQASWCQLRVLFASKSSAPVFPASPGRKGAQLYRCLLHRAFSELLDFLDKHRQAAQDSLEPAKHRLTHEAAIFLCANLDALYYDLFQFCLRTGCAGPTVPPPHVYFPAMSAAHPGEAFRLLKSIMATAAFKFLQIY